MEEIELSTIDKIIGFLSRVKDISFGSIVTSLLFLIIVKLFDFLKIFPKWRTELIESEMKNMDLKERKRKLQDNDDPNILI